MVIKRSTSFAIVCLAALVAPQIGHAQQQPQSQPLIAAFANPFGATFDKDPNKTDSEIRYNHDSGNNSGVPTAVEQPVQYAPGANRTNSISGIEWEDMNRFSKSGEQDYPEEKMHNELQKPMPQLRPFGDRMKQISDQLENEAEN